MGSSEERARVLAAALDLGSTSIKGALLEESGRLVGLRSVPSPAIRGTGPLREANPLDYLAAAREVLEALAAEAPAGVRLGLTSQRSSFVLWNHRSGRPRTPLISWQDRRAASWCAEHAEIGPEVLRRSGLALSAHYAGPKLAAMQATEPRLAAELEAGELLFGNLDAFVLRHWTAGKTHQTDLSMAARTSLVDLASGDWCPELLSLFRVPAPALPTIVPSGGRAVELVAGCVLTATLADQAASALSVFDPAEPAALVNLGTGGFVLLPTHEPGRRLPGYLTAPILGAAGASLRFVLEGAISGAGPAADRFGRGPTPLPENDPSPTAYALPDSAGLGSPHWRPDLELTLSEAARGLSASDQRRVVIEGLLFRVCEILADLSTLAVPRKILLSGGLAREVAVAQGLASLLDRPVELLEQRESTLLGVARLAAGLEPSSRVRSRTVEPGPAGTYLPEKYERWRRWLGALLAATPGA